MATDQDDLTSLEKQLADANATPHDPDHPYWEFLEQMAEGALSLSLKHDVLYCNPSLCDLIGLPRDVILGQPIKNWLDEPSLHQLLQASGQKGSSTMSATVLSAEHEQIPVLMSVVPVRSRSSRHCNVVVTEKRALSHGKQVTKAHGASIAESHDRDRFLAVLGHELRNPLAALTNSVAVLEEVSLTPERRQSVYSGMSRQIHQLNSLVADLLDLTRVAQGKIVLKRQLLALDDLLLDATNSVRTSIEQKGQALVVEVPRGLQVEADRVRLEQVLINLLTNASRYTSNGGTITLRARTKAGTLELSVSDTGIGIEAAQLERIFEPFAQVGEEGTGGLGIGLSLVRQLMHLHDGSVVATSSGLGLGTTVTLTLPNVRSEQPDERSGAAQRSPTNASESALRVLIVDDNEDAAEMLGLILSTMGHQTNSVSLGREVAAAIEQFKPEVVLLDLGLPDISGYAVAQQLREAGHRDLLIVALTGFSHDSARTRTIEAGINAHLIKPVTVEQILSTVAEFRKHPSNAV